MKQGRLVLKREDGELPITKIGDHHFSITKPSESEAEEFVLVPGVRWQGRVSAHRASCTEKGANQQVRERGSGVVSIGRVAQIGLVCQSKNVILTAGGAGVIAQGCDPA